MQKISAVSEILCAEGLVGALFDAFPEACLYVDASGRVQAASRLFGEYFGIAPDELVGKPIEMNAEPLGRCFTEFMSYHEVIGMPLRDAERDYARDVELSHPRHRFLQIASAPVAKAGAPAGRLWLMRDVTQEREITELKIQYGGLRASDELKSKFLTVISHQMRTPLNSVRWNVELLLGDVGRKAAPEELEVLRDVYRSVVNSISIVDDMLLAVDIEQRTLRLEKAPADLRDLLTKVVHDLSRSAELKSVKVVLGAMPEGLPRLFIDAGKIETVLARLLDNAIRYSPPGGEVAVDARVEAEAVAVAVRDNGIGIPEKERPRVFERFYRSKKAIETHPNASGLGLYISKYIVEAHDGTIDFVSEEGKGTTFTLRLPKRAAT